MEKNLKSETIGDRIKKTRKALGLTLRQMESDLGLSNASISRYENGFFDVPRRIQNLFCRTYSINPVWLETGEGEMEDKTSQKSVEYVINEIKKNLHLPDIVVAMIETYEKLPDNKKRVFEQFIDDLLAEQNGKKRREEDEEDDEDSDFEDISRIA